ncbi:MAG: hypothetical protein KDJ88_14920 [Bauldia sp.]|nr:hypothetical protein [Bauldia sp.]
MAVIKGDLYGPNPDVLYGTAFDDQIYGYEGDDWINLSAGHDTIYGGPGTDTISALGLVYPARGVGINLLQHKGTSGAVKGDSYDSIENILGSQYHDTLRGDNGNNVIAGDDGVDEIYGEGGDDILNGNWWLHDDGLADFLYGGDGNDTLDGGKGKDVLHGGDDDDILLGGAGADRMLGERGFDTVDYSASSKFVRVDLLNGKGFHGDAGGDELKSIESVIGSNFADDLTGGKHAEVLSGIGGDDDIDGGRGADILYGGDGRDKIRGGGGADHIDGGPGNDRLTGDKGNDTFVYKPGYGEDHIKDTKLGHDHIDLSAFHFANAAAVQNLASDVGKGVLIDFGFGDTLLIEHVDVGDLTIGFLIL